MSFVVVAPESISPTKNTLTPATAGTTTLLSVAKAGEAEHTTDSAQTDGAPSPQVLVERRVGLLHSDSLLVCMCRSRSRSRRSRRQDALQLSVSDVRFSGAGKRRRIAPVEGAVSFGHGTRKAYILRNPRQICVILVSSVHAHGHFRPACVHRAGDGDGDLLRWK
jgi:hypothetical protein